MTFTNIILFVVASTCLVQSLPQNTPQPGLNITPIPNDNAASPPAQKIEEPKVTSPAPTTLKTETRIKCLNDNCNTGLKDDNIKSVARKGAEQKSSKKELDDPSKESKIIDLHKSDDTTEVAHDVRGRKGMDPGVDFVTEINDQHVDDLNSLKKSSLTTSTSTTTTTTTTRRTTTTTITTTTKSISSTSISSTAQITSKENDIKENTSKTSLFVGIVLGAILISVLVFVGFKRLDAIRRRREYRRMNDFLIDGMYNEM